MRALRSTKINLETPSLDDAAPLGCCICHACFESAQHDESITPDYGVYTAKELMEKHHSSKKQWRCLYRMILYDPTTKKCQISGVSYHYWHKCREPAVPWDPEQGVVKHTTWQISGVTTPIVLQAVTDEFIGLSSSKVQGNPIHTRCWELLCEHPLAQFTRNDLLSVFKTLCYKGQAYAYRALSREQRRFNLCSEDEDPKISAHVRTLIRRATRSYGDPKVPSSRLCRLPPEVLSIVGEYLSVKQGIAVEEATGVYLGDPFWRRWIPWTMFPEVKAVRRAKLDWGLLYLLLKNFMEDSQQLVARKFILRRLDVIHNQLAPTPRRRRKASCR